MAIAFIGATTSSDRSTDTQTVTYPGGISAGELLLLVYGTGATTLNDLLSIPTGYSTAFEDTLDLRNFGVFYKVAAGTESGDISVVGGNSSKGVLSLLRWSGVDGTTPMDATPPSITGSSGTTLTAPSITTVTDGAAVVRLWYGRGSGAGQVITSPATEVFNRAENDPADLGNDLVLAASWATQTTAGASGTLNATQSVNDDWMTNTIAIRPAGAGGVVLPVFVHHYKQMGMI